MIGKYPLQISKAKNHDNNHVELFENASANFTDH